MSFVPQTAHEKKEMMEYLAIDKVMDLFSDVDDKLIIKSDLNLPDPLSEIEIAALMKNIALSCTNARDYACFLGGGAYNHFIPSAVTNLAQRGEFLSSYTPYQAEMSQGMLQTMFEFQSMICELTQMDVANASMYDGASALAEGAIMAAKATGRKCVLHPENLHPQYKQVLRTYLWAFGLDARQVACTDGVVDLNDLESRVDDSTACVIVQSPNFLGMLENQGEIGEIAHKKKTLFISCVVEPISLGLLKPPGAFGSDIVVGEGQPLGNPLSYGGPHFGFMAAKEDFLKRLPGRLSGLTLDKNGEPGFILTLQAREQHVRRERATSNICTNQAQAALAATIYMALMGKSGLEEVARICAHRAHYARNRILEIEGFESAFKAPFFNEFPVACPKPPLQINDSLIKQQIIGGLPLGKHYEGLGNNMLLAVTEMNSRAQIDHLAEALSEVVA